jgi:uncharacterized protein YaaR (DUF327 family)
MIDITPTTPKKDEKTKIKSKRRSLPVDRARGDIKASFEESIQFNIQGTIDELMSDLDHQEKSFIEKQSLFEMNRYKAIVQKILKTVLEQGFETRKLKPTRKDRGDFVIVEKINEKLLALTVEITKKRSGFNLLKAIEEIRGLLLDLVM